MSKRDQLTAEIVRELLDYNLETGIFIWKERDPKWFIRDHDCKRWNRKNAGKQAFTCVSSDGYLSGSIFRIGVLAHQVAFLWVTGHWPKPEIDHINRVRTDNRFCNLREATVFQNSQNRNLPNRTGTIGVSLTGWGSYCVRLG